MPDAPDGVSWIVWLIAIIATPLLGAAASIGVALITRRDTKRELGEIGPAVKATVEQVKNTHETNLRVDVDEAKASAAAAEQHAANANVNAQLASESSTRTERLVKDLVITMRAMEHAIDRRDRLHADAMTGIDEDVRAVRADLAEHLDQVPQIIEDAFNRHAGRLPCSAELGKGKPVNDDDRPEWEDDDPVPNELQPAEADQVTDENLADFEANHPADPAEEGTEGLA